MERRAGTPAALLDPVHIHPRALDRLGHPGERGLGLGIECRLGVVRIRATRGPVQERSARPGSDRTPARTRGTPGPANSRACHGPRHRQARQPPRAHRVRGQRPMARCACSHSTPRHSITERCQRDGVYASGNCAACGGHGG
jgi:hypothetical protein